MFYMITIPALLVLGVIMTAMLGTPSESDRRNQQATDQLAQYQTFMYTAKTYFERNAAPASNTAYSWTTLKTAATPAMINAGIPSYWKAVRQADGTWVACTEMSPTSTANISSLFPAQSGTLGTATISIVPSAVPSGSITSIVGTGGASPTGGTPTYVVIGQQTTAAAASANLCAGT
jgi:hypothetical protein